MSKPDYELAGFPRDGEWPCQTRTEARSLNDKGGPPYQQMVGDVPVPERLVAALYRLLRDHVAPGDMEQVLLDVGRHNPVEAVKFTNRHLEGLARAHAAYLLAGVQ